MNMSSREFVDTVTRDLLGSRVFVFTPRGEVIVIIDVAGKGTVSNAYLVLNFLQIKNLPKGATVIDYAYMIHTEVGNKMVAAKVMVLCLMYIFYL